MSYPKKIASRSRFASGLLVVVMVLISMAGDDPARNLQDVPEKLTVPEIENIFRLSPKLYSGGKPRGEAGFSALKRLGVKTIISVDGATPDVENARKLGLRYVHLPVGYDGIPRNQSIRIIKATQTLPGPVYIHCHHGIHRGPTAAGLCVMALEGWDKPRTISWMNKAGTAADYKGLFATVDAFTIPTPEELATVKADFPEKAEPSSLVDLMVAIDKRWDLLKESKTAGFYPPKTQPDIDLRHESLQLKEQFEELTRQAKATGQAENFSRQAGESARRSGDLEVALTRFAKTPSQEVRKEVETAFDAIGKSCKSCHVQHRDQRSN